MGEIVLGIEGTAHSFGVGIIKGKKILANEKTVFRGVGIHPTKAAELHSMKGSKVLEKAFEKAKVKIKDINVIAYSRGPGLGQTLKHAAFFASVLGKKYGVPVLGVNHCIAHIEIGKATTKVRDPITLYVSGANTQIIGYENRRYRIYGETLDIGVGNAVDMLGRDLGYEFPGGPRLDKNYFKGKKYLDLPYTVKGMDFAFSGLYTAAKQKIGRERDEDIAYSFLHNCFAMLTEATERALAYTQKKELLLTGGVAASKALRQMMEKMCKERKAKMFVPDFSLCVDNAAMIAWQGLLEWKNGRREKRPEIKPKERTDMVDVFWIKN